MSRPLSKTSRKAFLGGLLAGIFLLVLVWAISDLSRAGGDYAHRRLNQADRGLTVYIFKPGQEKEPAKWRRLAGARTSFALGPNPGAVNYRTRLMGWVRLTESQTITLALGSDDGARARINGIRVLNDWTEHPIRKKVGDVSLDSGDHLLEVDYFQAEGDAFLNLSITGEDGRAIEPHPLDRGFDPARWLGLLANGRLWTPWLGLILAFLVSAGVGCALREPLALAFKVRFSRSGKNRRP